MRLSSLKQGQSRPKWALLVVCAILLRVLCGCEASQVLDPFPGRAELSEGSVPCDDDGDCGKREPYCSVSNVCVECDMNAHCEAETPEKPLCNLNTCIECLDDDDCADRQQPSRLYCEPTRGRCRECLQDVHCRSTERCNADELRCVDRNPN